jgi:hypothetical protein
MSVDHIGGVIGCVREWIATFDRGIPAAEGAWCALDVAIVELGRLRREIDALDTALAAETRQD